MGSLFSEQSTKAFSPPPNPPLGLVVKRMDFKKKKKKKKKKNSLWTLNNPLVDCPIKNIFFAVSLYHANK